MTTSSFRAYRANTLRAASALAFAVLLSSHLAPSAFAAPPTKSPDNNTVQPRIAIGSQTTPGDETHLFRITQPGSYYLESSFTGIAGKKGIGIFIGGVSLDLNGHSAVGVPGSQEGILILDSHGPVKIFNGFVQNWGAEGIEISNATVELDSIVVSDNYAGIRIANASTVAITRCVAEQNATVGINSNTAGMPVVTLIDSVARSNGTVGFSLVRSVTRGCSAFQNGSHGFEIWGSTVTECIAESNGGCGILTNSSLVSHSTIMSNSGAAGILAGGAATIIDNVVHGHGGTNQIGILASAASNRIEGNSLVGNQIGIKVTSVRNVVARNTVRSLGTTYQIAAGNRVGTIVGASNTAIDGNSGGGSGTTDPWSNIAY